MDKDNDRDFFSRDFVVCDGDLADLLSATAPVITDLSREERAKILHAKEYLSKQTPILRGYKTLYFKMITTGGVSPKIQDRISGLKRNATPQDILRTCQSLQAHMLKYIKFLEEKATKLTRYRQFQDAINLRKNILDYMKPVMGDEHIETLGASLDLATAYIGNLDVANGIQIIQQVLQELQDRFKYLPENDEIKKMMAICHYYLAQYYYDQSNLSAAEQHNNESSELRESYGAIEEEMDRVRLLRGRLALARKDTTLAYREVKACYDFRKKMQGELSGDLFPVLETLEKIEHRVGNIRGEIQCLEDLLVIARSLNIDRLEIILIQVRMIHVMRGYTPTKEYLQVMDEVQGELSKIEIQGENFKLARVYIELAELRLDSPPSQEYSHVEKAEFYSVTMIKFLAVAEAHLQPLDGQLNVQGLLDNLAALKERCQELIDFHNDPDTAKMVSNVSGNPLHPDDVLAALPASVADAPGSGTAEELKALSEFSSEVDYSLVAAEDAYLTVEEFERLEEEGFINPFKLRVAQGGINPKFRDGKSLDETKRNLVKNPAYTKQIPPIEIGVYEDKVFSFDTRRLITHQKAKEENPSILIRYKKIFGDELDERVRRIFSPRPWNGAVTAERFGGKNSSSTPYINPALRPQLEGSVSQDFKSFPNDRKDADGNGFPLTKKKASKIHAFLVQKAKGGSVFSKNKLREAKQVLDKEGEVACWNFLIRVKQRETSQFQEFAGFAADSPPMPVAKPRVSQSSVSIFAHEQLASLKSLLDAAKKREALTDKETVRITFDTQDIAEDFQKRLQTAVQSGAAAASELQYRIEVLTIFDDSEAGASAASAAAAVKKAYSVTISKAEYNAIVGGSSDYDALCESSSVLQQYRS